MKKILLLLLSLILVLVSVVVINTLGFESKQIVVRPADPATVDGQRVAEELSQALRFRTISHEDPEQFDVDEFLALHEFLESTYPKVHASLNLEKVNDFSLLYTWRGSDPSLEPALLMAHIDVVPVEPGTEGDWTHPAYSGTIADGFVWGRGAMDNKHCVVTILHAVENLLSQGYQPRRTLYLAFGHDEEVGGENGARKIAEKLASQNVKLDFVLDEGGAVADGSMVGLSNPIAAVSIAEKGFVNLELTVEVDGGHSSVPPKNTAVGILGKAISELEENQVPGGLRPPVTDMLAYMGPEMPFSRKMVFANLWLFGRVVEGFFGESPITNAMSRTTTAATIIHAGVKANVLPSTGRAVVNFRILPGDTVESVTEHVRNTINDDRVVVSVLDPVQNPSPVSSLERPAWTTLQKTIRELFPDAVVVPSLLVGGSDSKHFAPLTQSVYRFAGVRMGSDSLSRAHGTDERLSLENVEQLTRFFIHLVRNSNETDGPAL